MGKEQGVAMRGAMDQTGTKFIFVTGGVTSSVGKGSTAASLGRLLKRRGLKVGMQKFDAYYNINTGLMSPLQHGEVYVTADGGECDLDIGSYERFIDVDLNRDSDITSGKIYKAVIDKERRGDYNGGTVQVIPHVTDEIKKALYRCARSTGAEVLLTEIGGTVGDIETQPFLEACRQMRQEVGMANSMFIHVALVPYLVAAGELKTKPTQHSVRQLRSFGIQPDCIICRSEYALDEAMKSKIGLFCNVSAKQVISDIDIDPIYELPAQLQREGLDNLVLERLGLAAPPAAEDDWHALLESYQAAQRSVRVALVGKYVDLHDAYLSVTEALTHAGIAEGCRMDIDWVYSGDITCAEDAERLLGQADAIVAPGGFGERGMEGLVRTAHYAREHKVPFLGIGLGMQMALVDFARCVCGLEDADSTEANPRTPHPVLALMEDYKDDGTMRLGNDRIVLAEGSRIRALYGQEHITERHRNRYEINPAYEPALAEGGLWIAGRSKLLKLGASIELPASVHPFFLGAAYHAEFSTRLERPHPLFVGLIQAAKQQQSAPADPARLEKMET